MEGLGGCYDDDMKPKPTILRIPPRQFRAELEIVEARQVVRMGSYKGLKAFKWRDRIVVSDPMACLRKAEVEG